MPPTRKERQAHTRECLLRSAARVFARRGLQQASIDEVAQDAGFTKGAFYANFRSKEELFLAMLDEQFARRIEEMNARLAGDELPTEQARAAGDAFARYALGQREWERLFFEFAAHAARHEDFRQELVTRYRSLRGHMAAMYRERAERLGHESPIAYDDLALMVFAMCNGFALESLLEPGDVPETLLGEMLETFFTGLRVRAGLPDAATEQAL